MKLFSYFTEDRQVRIGIKYKDTHYNFTQIWEFFKDIKGFHKSPQLIFIQMMVELDFFNIQDITEVMDTVQDFRAIDDLVIEKNIEFDVPITRPQKIICISRNYLKHAEELGNKAPGEPIFFAKMPSSLLPHEGKVILPQDAGRIDHEIELGVVISKQGKNIPENNVSEYIAGYTIVNDITAREMQKNDLKKQHPWLRSKSFDTFCPIGPYLVPADAISEPQNLELTLKVNGEIKQQSNTSRMIFNIQQLISYISKYMTLYPCDIIATGTPDGVSSLNSGDEITAEIDYLGLLKNNVI